jgi:DNA-3-methyladenine glycosylase I
MIRYHDREWGVPLHDDRRLFEVLILEGAQAGLSWSTILRKRAAYRRAFARFDARAIAGWGAREVRKLLADAGIVRNRAKVQATIARGFRFVGPTICYAFMQATGMVNDHARGCFRRRQVRRLGRLGRRTPG